MQQTQDPSTYRPREYCLEDKNHTVHHFTFFFPFLWTQLVTHHYRCTVICPAGIGQNESRWVSAGLIV